MSIRRCKYLIMSNTYCRAAQEQLFITVKGKMQPCCYTESQDSSNPNFVSSRLFNVKDLIDCFYNNKTQLELRNNLYLGPSQPTAGLYRVLP